MALEVLAAAAVLTAAACTSDSGRSDRAAPRTGLGPHPSVEAAGSIRGQMIMDGIGGSGPVPGTVRISSGETSRTVALSPDGDFVVRVPPGSYQVTGTSPRFASGKEECFAFSTVPVWPGLTVVANVICAEK